MLSQEDADACIEAASTELKSLSYEELERLAKRCNNIDTWECRELQLGDETVYVNMMICRLGRLHKRIGVEMTLSAEGDIQWSDTPCVYFERYQSGRLYDPPPPGKLVCAILRALPYAFLVGVVVVLLALVWQYRSAVCNGRVG